MGWRAIVASASAFHLRDTGRRIDQPEVAWHFAGKNRTLDRACTGIVDFQLLFLYVSHLCQLSVFFDQPFFYACFLGGGVATLVAETGFPGSSLARNTAFVACCSRAFFWSLARLRRYFSLSI